MPARTRPSSMDAVRKIRRGTALVPAHATTANVPTRGEPAQCSVRAPRSSPFLARPSQMRWHPIASASPGRGCGPWTVLPFVDACTDRVVALCESESHIPNPLFIVSHAHVNKKQRRIAQSMQDFSNVVRCDAFMPQIRVVQASFATTKRAPPGYERRRNGGARKTVRDAAACSSSPLQVAMKRAASSVWRRQTLASTTCASHLHHLFMLNNAASRTGRAGYSTRRGDRPMRCADGPMCRADHPTCRTGRPMRHADEGRHPRLCCVHRGKSWMPTFVGMTGAAVAAPSPATAWRPWFAAQARNAGEVRAVRKQKPPRHRCRGGCVPQPESL
jgi:hypothetical protein